MKTTIFTFLLGLLVLTGSVAQDLYQGPKAENLFTKPAEKSFMQAFADKFKADFDTKGQYEKARTTNVDEWEMGLFNARKAQAAFYKGYPQAGEFSDAFKKYVESSIRWNYWHLILAYPILRGNAQTTQTKLMSLPEVMLDGFDEAKANDADALPAEPYRNFLFYYVTYFNSRARNFQKYTQEDIHKSLGDKANYAKQHLTGAPYQYAISRLLLENYDKVAPSSVRAVYNMLTATPNSAAYAEAVKAKIGEVMNKKDEPVVAATTPKQRTIPPNTFSYTNLKGEKVILDDFKGKVVYVDFWASWCGPCRAEFPFSKQLHERLTDKQKEKIVFLYISIDEKEPTWKNALNALQLIGEQGWNPGAAQYFGIPSIPRYMLINKKGEIIDGNAKRPSSGDAVLADMLKLAEE